VRTIAHAASLLRDRTGDQMLLNRGDAWRETFGMWTKSGRSAAEPMVIGAYGAGPRPRVETGSQTAFFIGASGKSSASVDHLDLIGIHLAAHTRLPASPDFAGAPGGSGDLGGGAGIRVLSRADGLLVEDCVVEGYATNVVLQDYSGAPANVTVRRSLIADAYSAGDGHSQGLYAYGVRNLLLEENVFDHNGWNAAVPGANATVFNHNVYFASNNTGVVVRRNVIADASSHGLQARSGGRIEDNVFLGNPIGLTFGVVKGATTTAGGVAGVVNGNVFLGARDIDGSPRGKALEIGNTRPGFPTIVSNNVFADDTAKSDYAIFLSYGGGGANPEEAVRPGSA
jgi:hypothetical protein